MNMKATPDLPISDDDIRKLLKKIADKKDFFGVMMQSRSVLVLGEQEAGMPKDRDISDRWLSSVPKSDPIKKELKDFSDDLKHAFKLLSRSSFVKISNTEEIITQYRVEISKIEADIKSTEEARIRENARRRTQGKPELEKSLSNKYKEEMLENLKFKLEMLRNSPDALAAIDINRELENRSQLELEFRRVFNRTIKANFSTGQFVFSKSEEASLFDYFKTHPEIFKVFQNHIDNLNRAQSSLDDYLRKATDYFHPPLSEPVPGLHRVLPRSRKPPKAMADPEVLAHAKMLGNDLNILYPSEGILVRTLPSGMIIVSAKDAESLNNIASKLMSEISQVLYTGRDFRIYAKDLPVVMSCISKIVEKNKVKDEVYRSLPDNLTLDEIEKRIKDLHGEMHLLKRKTGSKEELNKRLKEHGRTLPKDEVKVISEVITFWENLEAISEALEIKRISKITELAQLERLRKVFKILYPGYKFEIKESTSHPDKVNIIIGDTVSKSKFEDAINKIQENLNAILQTPEAIPFLSNVEHGMIQFPIVALEGLTDAVLSELRDIVSEKEKPVEPPPRSRGSSGPRY